MTLTRPSTPEARVEWVLQAARRLRSTSDPLGIEARAHLPRLTGLSPEGVALALEEHLETHTDAASLQQLLAAVSVAPRCHVVLSANVFTAAVRALALACATSPVVRLRPSRREPLVAELLVQALRESPAAASMDVRCVSSLEVQPGDEVHAYGSDATMEAIVKTLPLGSLFRAHGSGLGLAVLGEEDDLGQIDRLAADVVAFDQRGCLSPRALLVEGEPARARQAAARLHEALEGWGRRVPRGDVLPSEQAILRRWRTTLEALGEVWAAPDHIVAWDALPRSLHVPPASRAMLVVSGSIETLSGLMAPLVPWITCLGVARTDGRIAAQVGSWLPRARMSPFGHMQKPPLDGPVDRRGRLTLVAKSSVCRPGLL